jgi:ligand-binding sensor domain-containing protein
LFKYNRDTDQFVPFFNVPTDPNSITKDFVNVLITDQENNIWIGLWNSDVSTDGLIRFDPGTNIAQRFLNDPNNSISLTDNRISAPLADQEGKIWIGTVQNGLHQYNAKTAGFNRILADTAHLEYLQPPFPHENHDVRSWAVNILHQNQNGTFWVGSVDMGLNPNDPIMAQTADATVYHITGIGLNYFDPVKEKLSTYDLSKLRKVPTTLFEDGQGMYNKLHYMLIKAAAFIT